MTLETHLTPPTAPENVSMALKVYLTSSTTHGNVLSETPLTPSTSGISNTYSLGTQVKLPKLESLMETEASGPRSGMHLNHLCTTILN